MQRPPPFCLPPIASSCATQSDYNNLVELGVRGGSQEYDPSRFANTAACQQSIINYQAQELTYQVCLNTQSNYQSLAPIATTAGTFQLLNVATSTKVVVGQQYSAYFNFLYSGNGMAHVSLVGQNVPSGMQLGAVSYGVNGVDNIRYSGIPAIAMDYPMTLELTDNHGALLTQPFDFNVISSDSAINVITSSLPNGTVGVIVLCHH